ncbi:conjugal transfer protein TraR [Pseudomonas sp. KSR10]|uniref:conjugal transfer protein TraR n=1 Tax=Pseudomonas sp. KSR10 TaxID=2916654 RepID=UPI001EF953F7|nr:conjugal transfer protein TraR [Pseudomonas sp. KSR10]MCG6541732.1 conjugal transfer protein TraR [Pseudomonas sp. KSR10]
MADIADVTNDRILDELDQRLAARKLSGPRRVAEECEECGVKIPEERHKALLGRDCLLCAYCQTATESLASRGRRA